MKSKKVALAAFLATAAAGIGLKAYHKKKDKEPIDRRLTQEKDRLEKSISDTQCDIRSILSSIVFLSTTTNQNESTIKDLQHTEKYHSRITILQSALQTPEPSSISTQSTPLTLDDRLSRLAELFPTEISHLQNQTTSQNATITGLNSRLERSNTDINRLQSLVEEERESANKAIETLEVVRKKDSQLMNDLGAVRGSLDVRDTQLEELGRVKEKLEEDLKGLRLHLDQEKDTIKSLKKDKANGEERVRGLEEHVLSQKHEILELQEKIEELQRERSGIVRERDTMRETINNMESQLHSMKFLNSHHSQEIANLTNTIHTYEITNHDLTSRTRLLSAEVNESQNACHRIKKTSRDATSALKTEIDALKSTVAALQTENAGLAPLQSKVASLEHHRNQLLESSILKPEESETRVTRLVNQREDLMRDLNQTQEELKSCVAHREERALKHAEDKQKLLHEVDSYRERLADARDEQTRLEANFESREKHVKLEVGGLREELLAVKSSKETAQQELRKSKTEITALQHAQQDDASTRKEEQSSHQSTLMSLQKQIADISTDAAANSEHAKRQIEDLQKSLHQHQTASETAKVKLRKKEAELLATKKSAETEIKKLETHISNNSNPKSANKTTQPSLQSEQNRKRKRYRWRTRLISGWKRSLRGDWR
ncbi:hypothetical protein HK097_009736 [Rhizophlyctis rosea]|uniref:Uncharacterized protein n=1 Tax=Rhizophlyctis rosea TaxID=64517 RepID=A0AAD5S8H8_9FUNG|nr:hypothetical protein HK097_009736 [Rhizophlyctis rosea]